MMTLRVVQDTRSLHCPWIVVTKAPEIVLAVLGASLAIRRAQVIAAPKLLDGDFSATTDSFGLGRVLLCPHNRVSNPPPAQLPSHASRLQAPWQGSQWLVNPATGPASPGLVEPGLEARERAQNGARGPGHDSKAPDFAGANQGRNGHLLPLFKQKKKLF
ncbi:hypothetical protein CRG98_045559 [Punica granatum]|uniref:Uncharacterized protein n=1 Tax=Punica granatum TaxID=22663 RepID=A0A2I0HQW8_PUNGR|nr:hypothetical protein CRG98_045559 [Punica granatum]